jgi:hypothetical protein
MQRFVALTQRAHACAVIEDCARSSLRFAPRVRVLQDARPHDCAMVDRVSAQGLTLRDDRVSREPSARHRWNVT